MLEDLFDFAFELHKFLRIFDCKMSEFIILSYEKSEEDFD